MILLANAIEISKTELGAMTSVIDALYQAKTLKESGKLQAEIKNFLRSMGNLHRQTLPIKYKITGIYHMFNVETQDIIYRFYLEIPPCPSSSQDSLVDSSAL